MKILFRSLLIITLGLCLQACSYSVEFVLVNESDTTIEVEYSGERMVSNSSGETEIVQGFIPKTMSYGKWDGSYQQEDWTPLPSTEFQVNPVIDRFKLKVPPRTVLRLAQVSDMVFFQEGYRDFEIKSIKIRGLYGSMAFEGVELFRQFVEKGRQSYYIAYKQ